jgi:AraC family transcriptional regulator
MSELEVRIEKLGPMRVAHTIAVSESPETDAWEKLTAWAKPKGLMDDIEQHKLYGFNNPNPSPGKKEYGYEVWVTVGDDIKPEGEIGVKEFEGGLYAVASITAQKGEDIMEAWNKMCAWHKQSGYKPGKHQWLERSVSISGFDAPGGLRLDLFMPIAE